VQPDRLLHTARAGRDSIAELLSRCTAECSSRGVHSIPAVNRTNQRTVPGRKLRELVQELRVGASFCATPTVYAPIAPNAVSAFASTFY